MCLKHRVYVFHLVEARGHMAVVYVGLTTWLPMVALGVKGGMARPGQRYGRPKYAGQTRQRINVLVAHEVAAGRTIRHWLRPFAAVGLVKTKSGSFGLGAFASRDGIWDRPR